MFTRKGVAGQRASTGAAPLALGNKRHGPRQAAGPGAARTRAAIRPRAAQPWSGAPSARPRRGTRPLARRPGPAAAARPAVNFCVGSADHRNSSSRAWRDGGGGGGSTASGFGGERQAKRQRVGRCAGGPTSRPFPAKAAAAARAPSPWCVPRKHLALPGKPRASARPHPEALRELVVHRPQLGLDGVLALGCAQGGGQGSVAGVSAEQP